MVVVISAALAIMAVWCLFNPFVGLLGVLLILFIRPGELYPILDSIRIERTFALLVLVSFLVHQRRLQFPKVSKAVLILWGAMFLTIPLAFWRAEAFQNSLDFGKIIIYHVLIANLITTMKRFRIVLITICGLITWLAAWCAYLYYAGQFQVRMGIERAVGANSRADDPNALGITLITALPLFLLLWRKEVGFIRWLIIPCTFVCVWTVVLTGSRTSYIVFAFLLLVYAMTTRYRAVMTVGAIVLLLALWVAMPAQYKQRLETVDNLSADGSYQGRVDAWRFAWEIFKDSPLTGVGIGEFVDVHGARTGHWLNVHSLYFQVLSEMGLLGIITFGYFLVSVFRQNALIARQARKIRNCPKWFRQYPVACNLAFIGLMFTGYSAHNLGRDTWYFFAGITAAAGMVAQKELRAQERAATETKPVKASAQPVLAGVKA